MYAFSFGVFASELPLQMIAGQFAALVAITRRLSPRLRRFSWLVSALSWLGLLGLNRLGHQANLPLTAALDAGLGTDRRTESADPWKRPAGAGVANRDTKPQLTLRWSLLMSVDELPVLPRRRDYRVHHVLRGP
jgi:hypothetical protein